MLRVGQVAKLPDADDKFIHRCQVAAQPDLLKLSVGPGLKFVIAL
jgi:hypothetical protein